MEIEHSQNPPEAADRDPNCDASQEEYLTNRAVRGNRAAFEAALSRVPVVPPDPHDAL